ncbi:MAG: N-acetylmuramoyl-L-alanine amidase [Clostridiales bacterium]|nr:N-acetylmuramoyl-L-alanine amidase [Clostridiales bacterium]
MKRKYNRIWSLVLAGVLTFSGAVPAAAAEGQPDNLPVSQQQVQEETSSEQQTPEETSPERQMPEEDSAPGALGAGFLYAELSQDETTQNVVVKLETDETLESAVLFSETSQGKEETSASQIIGNYAAFQLPASESRTFTGVESTIGELTYETDLAPLEEGTKLDTEDFQDSAESAVAAYSLDSDAEEQKAAIAGSVITTNLDEAVSGEEIADSVDAAGSSVKTRTTAQTPSDENRKKIIVLDPGHGAAGSGTYRDWGDFIVDEAIINFKISNYTKEALETNYSNIEVYLTKTTQNEKPDISERVAFAVEKKADILVSQHVNATTETVTKANGVLAMVPKLDPNHNYHEETVKETHELARSILDELVKLGFNDMDFQYRLGSSSYEDGSQADYYGIIRYCRINNLPGTIIEHGFANNRNDALKLTNENMLKRIGEADAAGIAQYLNLSSGTSDTPEEPTPPPTVTPTPMPTPTPKPPTVSKNEWILSGGRWWYRHADGSYTKSNWEMINGQWYLFDSSGWMLTGWQMKNGSWYYMHSSGAMLTGWQFINGKWYYMNSSGAMLTGWQFINGKWYYMNSSGAMLTGWQFINGKWYYMNSSGAMLTGWQWINGKCYYMDASGAMASNTWIGTDYVDSSGAWVPGKTQEASAKWILSGGRWWYRHGDGSYTKSGWEKINGQWYLFDSSGWMLTGWQMVNGTWYYMNGSGAMLTGWQFINNKWYYMNSSGAMLTGWQTINGKTYYLSASGAMVTGKQTISGKVYYFQSSGALSA